MNNLSDIKVVVEEEAGKGKHHTHDIHEALKGRSDDQMCQNVVNEKTCWDHYMSEEGAELPSHIIDKVCSRCNYVLHDACTQNSNA